MHAPAVHGSTSNVAPGSAATHFDANAIVQVSAAAKLLSIAASGRHTMLAASAPMPVFTIRCAHAITAMFAISPPGVKRPNVRAVMGAPAIHAAKDTPMPAHHRAAREPGRNHGDSERVHFIHSTIPSMTVNESVQPMSNSRSGERP